MADMKGNKIFAVDFDGTLSIGARWPACGEPNKPLINLLLKQQAAGAHLILWTCRNGANLEEAVTFCTDHGLKFDTINENLPELVEAYGGDTRKINADYYIDDKNTFILECGQVYKTFPGKRGLKAWLKRLLKISI